MQCSQLADGVDEACCPQFTTCARNYNASTTWVRCDIRQSALQTLEASTSSISGVRSKTEAETDSEAVQSTLSTSQSSTQSSTQYTRNTTSVSTTQPASSSSIASDWTTQKVVNPSESATTLQSAPTESTTASSAQPFSMGATIGIAISIAIAMLVLAAGAWLYFRKRATAKQQWPLSQSAHAPEEDAKLHGERSRPVWDNMHVRAYEMEDSTSKKELPGGQLSPKEMQGKEGFTKPGPVELEGSLR